MKKPLISIIIPTYNRANLIGETLDTLISQTYQNWECIIVDDGSSDNITEVIDDYISNDIRFKFYKRPDNEKKGPNSCRNFGFIKSKGLYIKWMDSDDLFLENTLNYQINKFKDDTDVVICHVLKKNLTTNKEGTVNRIKSKNLIGSYLTGEIAFYVSGPLWKKSFLEKNDLIFDPNITNLDDWDFNLRALYKNPSIIYVEEPLIIYRYNETSLTADLKNLRKNEIISEFYARNKHLNYLVNNDLENYRVLYNFLFLRHKFFLKTALVQKNKKISQWLYFRILKKYYKTKMKKKLFKISIGFFSFKIFGMGYKFMK